MFSAEYAKNSIDDILIQITISKQRLSKKTCIYLFSTSAITGLGVNKQKVFLKATNLLV